jgi:hypothetical protein
MAPLTWAAFPCMDDVPWQTNLGHQRRAPQIHVQIVRIRNTGMKKDKKCMNTKKK